MSLSEMRPADVRGSLPESEGPRSPWADGGVRDDQTPGMTARTPGSPPHHGYAAGARALIQAARRADAAGHTEARDKLLDEAEQLLGHMVAAMPTDRRKA